MSSAVPVLQSPVGPRAATVSVSFKKKILKVLESGLCKFLILNHESTPSVFVATFGT